MASCNSKNKTQKTQNKDQTRVSYEKLEDMPNIGKVAAERLREAGIETPEQLCAVGSKEALLRLRERDPGACLSMLCGLEGAIQGVRWHDLPEETKKDLKDFHKNLD